uniref:Uncharacterized protein n=1 Tax=Anguilla anguilla TaxID=7936 RepID=A0A0E9UTW0_ANGAN
MVTMHFTIKRHKTNHLILIKLLLDHCYQLSIQVTV